MRVRVEKKIGETSQKIKKNLLANRGKSFEQMSPLIKLKKFANAHNKKCSSVHNKQGASFGDLGGASTPTAAAGSSEKYLNFQ